MCGRGFILKIYKLQETLTGQRWGKKSVLPGDQIHWEQTNVQGEAGFRS